MKYDAFLTLKRFRPAFIVVGIIALVGGILDKNFIGIVLAAMFGLVILLSTRTVQDDRA